jgi:trigger factor
MSEITITKTSEDAASKALRVTVPVEQVHAAEQRAISEYGRRAKVPGFRPGKTPEGVVRKRFGAAIKQWVLEEVIRDSWEKARTEENLKPINDPSVRNLKFEDGQPVEFEFLVEVKPEITLARTGGFTVTRRVPPVTDTMVTEQLDQMREQKAAWLPVEGQAPVPGQMVHIEVASIEDGETKEPQTYNVVLGQGQALPALEEHVLSLKPGESADVDVKFPDDHPDPSRRGQSRRVHVTLHEVKRQELPLLDDAFAKEVGDFEDVAALTAAVRTDLERGAEREADAGVREQLLRQIIEANSVPAPESLVHRALHALLHAYRVPHEREQAFYDEFRPVAVGQVQRELVIAAVAEANKLTATEDEIDERVAKIAASRGASPAQVYASLEKAKRLDELARSITEEKVFGLLQSQSTIQEDGK